MPNNIYIYIYNNPLLEVRAVGVDDRREDIILLIIIIMIMIMIMIMIIIMTMMITIIIMIIIIISIIVITDKCKERSSPP